MYVEVSIPVLIFKTFTYMIPERFEDKIFLGQSIKAPFNKKQIDGFITKIYLETNYKGKILNILNINKNCFTITPELWKTIIWISKYYICPIGMVLNKTIQYQHNRNYSYPTNKFISITSLGSSSLNKIKYKAQKNILSYLEDNKNKKINIKILRTITPSYINICKKFEGYKYVSIITRDNISGIIKSKERNNKKSKIVLSEIQSKIYESIKSDWIEKKNKPTFLSGLSGSGKTLVYIKSLDFF